MKQSQRWNTLRICLRWDLNFGGSDLWSNALPIIPRRRGRWVNDWVLSLALTLVTLGTCIQMKQSYDTSNSEIQTPICKSTVQYSTKCTTQMSVCVCVCVSSDAKKKNRYLGSIQTMTWSYLSKRKLASLYFCPLGNLLPSIQTLFSYHWREFKIKWFASIKWKIWDY